MKRRRQSAADARAAILEVAERQLAGGGPAAVRVQKVASELGLTDAAVHYHFGNREKLMAALLKNAGRKLKTLFQDDASPDAGNDVVTTIMARLDDCYRRQGYARLAMWLALEGWRSEGTGVFRPMAERLHKATGGDADMDEALLAVAALNVFMMGEALAGAEMLAAVGLPTDAPSRERLRAFFARLVQEELRLAPRRPGSSTRRVGPGKSGTRLDKRRRRPPKGGARTGRREKQV